MTEESSLLATTEEASLLAVTETRATREDVFTWLYGLRTGTTTRPFKWPENDTIFMKSLRVYLSIISNCD